MTVSQASYFEISFSRSFLDIGVVSPYFANSWEYLWSMGTHSILFNNSIISRGGGKTKNHIFFEHNSFISFLIIYFISRLFIIMDDFFVFLNKICKCRQNNYWCRLAWNNNILIHLISPSTLPLLWNIVAPFQPERLII